MAAEVVTPAAFPEIWTIEIPSRRGKTMQFQSKLLQRRVAAAGVTLNKIHDVYIKPDGRVEGEGRDVAETLDRADEVIERLSSPKSGRSHSLKAFPGKKP